MKIKDWLRTRKNWQKGAILGGMAGLMYVLAIITRDGSIRTDNLLEFFIMAPLYFILLPAILGALVGYLSSAIKNNMLKWGTCLAIIPAIATIVVFFLFQNCNDAGCGYLLLYPISAIILFCVGLIIGHVLDKRKNK